MKFCNQWKGRLKRMQNLIEVSHRGKVNILQLFKLAMSF